MRAWQVVKHGEPKEVMELSPKAVPEPGPGEVRIVVKAVALGLPDVFMCRGTYAFNPQIPFTPGQEVVGIVTAIGEGVELAVGTRVIATTSFIQGNGGFAEEALAPISATYRIPDDMPDEDAAAFLIPFQTAYIALARRGQLLRGETLLVHGGAGGVGSAAIQVGCALGAKVIATATGPERVEACLELGASSAIDIGTEDFTEAVIKATDGRGANVIFDPVGGDVFLRSFKCIANEGRVLAIGNSSGSWKNAATGAVVFKNCSVVGVLAALYDKDFLDHTHEQLLKLYAEGKIRPAKQEISFKDIPAALTDLVDRKVIGRVVAVL
ncbi:NADPH:quinone oxidoreductase family protein [Mycobacterium intracellulare]|jgi:NADPH2:quinone reductase|uniref:NADPH:quinone oxidoreductase family protein n=1 Tax=Mycobacterium intracellulare TaxID=1767 RepID=UPI001916726B|nr:NADPH:quinone oxidoreductase family protein [Mycobacterium intracellulare]BCO67468.1 oxidoreductase [Mycobacterium intracellulare]BCO73019.1 oxidoreductase [Mycobacterium intracellulare]BCO78467.1 oxidoreductase [Mycobacterium intracellulare]BCP31439.1 oxidoreductase [Mycobacterium intracellulare]BCP42384.1 oxidoreductase [Mycobacterium intracellulare]